MTAEILDIYKCSHCGKTIADVEDMASVLTIDGGPEGEACFGPKLTLCQECFANSGAIPEKYVAFYQGRLWGNCVELVTMGTLDEFLHPDRTI